MKQNYNNKDKHARICQHDHHARQQAVHATARASKRRVCLQTTSHHPPSHIFENLPSRPVVKETDIPIATA